MKLIQLLEAFRDAFAAEAAYCAGLQDHVKHAKFTALAKQAHDAAQESNWEVTYEIQAVTGTKSEAGAALREFLKKEPGRVFEAFKPPRMLGPDEIGSDFVPSGRKREASFFGSPGSGKTLSEARAWARDVALPACAAVGKTEAANPQNASRRVAEKLKKKLRETDAKWRALNKKHQRTVEKLKREQAGKAAALDCLRSSEAEVRELRLRFDSLTGNHNHALREMAQMKAKITGIPGGYSERQPLADEETRQVSGKSWYVSDDIEHGCCYVAAIRDGDGKLIGEAGESEDAVLMAAAPKLVRALMRVLPQYEALLRDCGLQSVETVQFARALIAEATGQEGGAA